MTTPSEDLELAAGFPAASRDQWRDLVTGVLARSGAAADVDPEAALSSVTDDGLAIRGLYTDADVDLDSLGLPGQAPFVRGAQAPQGGWDVRQRHDDRDAERANAAILEDLNRGVTSLWLACGDGQLAVAELPRVLEGVYLDLAPIVLDAGPDTLAAATELLGLCDANGVDANAIRGSIGADPIGAAFRARTGSSVDIDLVVDAAVLVENNPALSAVTVDGTAYHDAGAGDVDELAIVASAGVAYLRALTDAGRSIEQALAEIDFRYAVTDEQFVSIAKLRAARRIWARINELCDANPAEGQRQHAVTSAAMTTRRDPWVNVLRATVACFAAAAGGAQAITVTPFDAAVGRSDAFARRLARNTQAILHDESSLGRVADPGGGSWYLESLTDELAQAAWTRFTQLEAAGGARSLSAVQALVADARTGRDDAIAHRRRPITGVSEFAFPAEVAISREPAPPSAVRRYAAPFEALRDRAESIPDRPRVLLVEFGSPASSSARAGFAANLFQAAGFDCVRTDPDAAVSELLDEPSLTCLCSSDDGYREQAAELTELLKRAGARAVWLAGRPPRGHGAYGAVDEFVFVGVNALDALTRALDEAGVPA